MRSDVKEELLELGPFSLRVLQLADLSGLIDAEALLRDEDVPDPPYWAHVWTGSRVLAHLVANTVECRNRRAIDLGCGLGVAGLAAAQGGARVLLADRVFDAVQLAQANARLNGLAVEVAVLDLLQSPLRGSFDLCLAADVTYDPLLQAALADFFAARLSQVGEAWCVESVRTTDRGFSDALLRRGLCVEERDLSALDEGRPVAVRVTVARR
ncbi:MAG TPA: methyltransferase [Terriglobales bacterium]|nr:methyltransferase [Terriglobales bacterium]